MPWAFLAIGGLVGLALLWRRSAPLHALVGLQVLGVIAFFVTSRYRLCLVPYLAVAAGWAVTECGRALWRRQGRRLILLALALVGAAGLVLPDWTGLERQPYGRPDFDRAMVLARLGQRVAALAAYERALVVHPDDPDVVYRYGEHLELMGRRREAIAAYANETFPHYQYVRFVPETFIASADGAVIEGTGFGVADGFQAPMRFMTFLRVADGEITAHADFFDYGEYEHLTRLRDQTRDTRRVTEACKGKAAQHFAFWPGSWVATIASGTEIGRNRIERAAGGCAIAENWDGVLVTDMKNHFARGLHWFDETSQAWRHIWVDDNGGVLEFKGKSEGGAIVYRPVREPDPNKRTRMMIRPLEDGRVEQYGEESTDRGKTWSETFRIFYSKSR